MKIQTEITDYLGIQDQLSDEDKLVRQTARAFVNA